MNRIPITVLTGFLGAGKSTTLNNILKQRGDKKLALIVNEFGDVGIDHQLLIPIDEAIYQINEGCICCTVREDLVNVLYSMNQAILAEKIEVDGVIIETTGIADVAPILQTLRQIPAMENYFEVDSVITLVDSVNAIFQIENFEEAQNQIAFADKILITKADLVDADKLAEVKELVRSVNPFAPMQVIENGNIEYKDVVGARLYNEAHVPAAETHDHECGEHGCCHHHHHDHDHDHECDDETCECHHHDHDHECDDENCECHHHDHDHECDDENCECHHHDHNHDHECDDENCGCHHHDHNHDHECDDENCGCHHHGHHHHHHTHEVTSFAMQTEKLMNIERFDYWLNWLLDLCEFNLLRYKGILCFQDTEEEMVMQGVLTNVTIDTNYKKIPTPPLSTIVLIGKNLPQKEIEEAFETMVLQEVE